MTNKISFRLSLSVIIVALLSPITSLQAAQALVSGAVIDEPVLLKGGSLVLASFKPGPGAEANDQTDKISVMLIKGIEEVLATNDVPFILKEGQEDEDADFVLDGFIEEFTRSGKMSRLMLKNQAHLSVDGGIWSQLSGTKVLVFSSSAIINMKKEKPVDVAYRMGRAIGRYISQRASKESFK